MSRKKTSRAGDEPAKTKPSDSPGSDATASPTDSMQTSADASDKSPEASLREGDEALPELEAESNTAATEAASFKGVGSKTLMGFRLDALTMAAFRVKPEDKPGETTGDEVDVEEKTSEEMPLPAHTLESKAAEEEGSEANSPPASDNEPTLVIEAKMLTNTSSDDTQVTSLLEEVAQALNLQASEYRDRARGKLPGMSVASPAAAPDVLGSNDLEFEDPDEPTGLTPGVRFGSDSETRNGRGLDAIDADDEAVVLGPATSTKSPAAGTDSKSGRLPPIPGLSGPVAAATVGPPPGGAARSATPASGLSLSSSGRVRLPTPPGSITIPPPSGRLSLPPGMMSAPAIPGRSSMSLDASVIAAARDSSSRRVSAPAATLGSGRATNRRAARVTQPMLDAARAMPAVLAAHVKIATVSLAGLIAVTFAGGLLVGMLVWRGQGRPGVDPSAATAAAGEAPTAAAGLAAPARVPAGIVQPVGAAGLGAGATSGAPRAPAVTGATMEAIVTPIAAEAAVEAAPPPPPRRALATSPRVRRPAPTPTVADTASLFPKTTVAAKPAVPAANTAPKTVASNAPAKAAPKSKVKTAWHDPFAD